MGYPENLERALAYIEEHIADDLDMESIAAMAYVSSFHFQRMFHFLTGFTLADYIRRRRLTVAAQELAMQKSKVIEVAYKYGYETPESFTKAFKRLHGITPAVARIPGASLKAFPKISFHISIRGENDMDYKIIEKPAFTVAGKGKRITSRNGENLKAVPAFWTECQAENSCEQLCALGGKGGILGICMDFDEKCEEFTYMIAVAEPTEKLPKGFITAKIPAATWAVFRAVGPIPGAIQDVWRRIFSEWFPATGYIHDEAPELEVYPEGDSGAPDYACEVWIPIKKK